MIKYTPTALESQAFPFLFLGCVLHGRNQPRWYTSFCKCPKRDTNLLFSYAKKYFIEWNRGSPPHNALIHLFSLEKENILREIRNHYWGSFCSSSTIWSRSWACFGLEVSSVLLEHRLSTQVSTQNWSKTLHIDHKKTGGRYSFLLCLKPCWKFLGEVNWGQSSLGCLVHTS